MHTKPPFDLLLKLKREFRRFLRVRGADALTQDAYLQQMKRTGIALYQEIRQACEADKTVIVYCDRGGGRSHVMRTLGRLNPDGITVCYSSQCHAAVCQSMCVLLAASSIKVVSALDDAPRAHE